MATTFRYPLSNGKTLTLEGDKEPSTSQVEEIARQQGVSLKGLETPSARTFPSKGTSDRTPIDAAEDFLRRNPINTGPSTSTSSASSQPAQDSESESGGLFNTIYKGVTTPLTHLLPTKQLDEFSNWITTPTLHDSPTSASLKGLVGGMAHGLGHMKDGGKEFSDLVTTPSLDDNKITAMLKGFVGGAGSGSVNVTNDLTSLASLAQLASGSKIPGITTAAKLTSIPGMIHGGGRVLSPDSTLGERGEGALEFAMNALGYHGAGLHGDSGVNTGPKNVEPPLDLPLHEAPSATPDYNIRRQPQGTPYDLPIRQPNTGFDLPLNPSNNRSRGLEYPLPAEGNAPTDLPINRPPEGPLPDLPLNQPTAPQGNDLPLNTGVSYGGDLPLKPDVNPSVSGAISSPPETWASPDLQVGTGQRRISLNEPAVPTSNEPTIQPSEPVDNGPRASVTNDPYQTLAEYTKQQRINEIIEKAKNGTITREEMDEGNRLLGASNGEPSQPDLPMEHPNAWGLSPLTEPSKLPPDNLSQGGLPFDRDFAPELGNTPEPEPPKVELTPEQKQTRLDEIIDKAQKGPLSIDEFREGNALHQELSQPTPKEPSLFNPKQSEGNPYIQDPNDLNSYAAANKLRNNLEGQAASMPDHPDHKVWAEAHDMADKAVTDFENAPTKPTEPTLAEDTGLTKGKRKGKGKKSIRKETGEEAASQIKDSNGDIIDTDTGEVVSKETSNEPTDEDQIANALKLKGQLEDVKAKPPTGQERPTPSMAASLPVGAKLTVSSKTFTPNVMKKLYEMGFDHDGMTDLGNHRFVKATDAPREAPILESEVGKIRPKATPQKQEQSLIGEVTNFSRSIMASLDMSAPLRQGIGLAHRKEFWNALPDMIKSWGSKDVYDGIMADINSRAMFKTRQGVGGNELPSFAQDAGLKLTNMFDLAAREESFMSNLAGKIPGVERSERAYSAFLNKLRADTFESLIKSGKAFGADGEINIAMAREIANFVNTATGRGSLGSLEKSATALNNTFFAPRLIASRLQMLNPATYVNASPMMRKEYLKSLFTIASSGMAVGQLAKMAGAKVETDPTSSDYGKIRIGDTRIDPYAGFQQYIVNAKRLMPHWASIGKPLNTGIVPIDLMSGLLSQPGGMTKSTTTGNKYELGAGYGKPTKLDVAQRFVEGKLNPVWSFATGMLKGKTFTGQPFDVPEEVASRVVPLIVQDIKELATEDPNLIPGIHRKNPYREFHPENLPAAVPAFFGAGVQPYSNFRHN